MTKRIDEICDGEISISFKFLDGLEDEAAKQWKELEEEYKEVFRVARRLEGYPRNLGVHASGILITPCEITDHFPTRTVDGIQVTLYSGEQIDAMNGVKYDILGLKTISVIDRTLKTIGISWEDLYKLAKVDDEKIFSMICDKKTDSVFQIESDLFKGVISDMKPTHLNDIIALTALCRPGPLTAKMHEKYNKRKNGLEEVSYPFDGVSHILEPNYGAIIYQEDIMRIARDVAGFDDNQADSYLRKATAKKKKDLMDLCKRWLIYGKKNEKAPEGYDNENVNSVMYDVDAKYGAPIMGALSKGITLPALETFWNDIEGFCSYLFNKSHAACYSYITLLTAYLKCYYPIEYFAEVLTVQDKEEKRNKYMNIIEKEGISIVPPNINVSQVDFIALPSENRIMYGLGGIKGVNNTSELLEKRPFASLEDMLDKVSKRGINKKVAESLIKSGALDQFDETKNRIALLNKFYEIRKTKIAEEDKLDPATYDRLATIEMERAVLCAPLTYKPWYDQVEIGDKVNMTFEIIKVTEKYDRKGGLMAFVVLKFEECELEAVVFSNKYGQFVQDFDTHDGHTHVYVEGRKGDNGNLIVNKARRAEA